MPRPSRSTRSCPLFRVLEVDVGNFQLAARRRLEVPGDLDDLVVEKIQSGHGERRFRVCRLLFEPDGTPLGVKLDDAVALGIADLIAKDRRPLPLCGRTLERLGKPGAIKDVVAKRQRDGALADKLATDDERLRQAIGAGL